MTKKISIITPTVGKWPTYEKWAQALMEHTSDVVLEHIIVWDACSIVSRLPDITQRYTLPSRRYILNPSPVGISRAFNMGAAIAKGDYLCFLEDAVYVTEGWLDKLLEALETKPSLGWVAATQLENDKATFTAMCSLIRRGLFDSIGKFDEQLEVFDDADLILRLRSWDNRWTLILDKPESISPTRYKPHGLRDVKVSHPETRTTTGDIRGGKNSPEERAHFNAMRERFRKKHNMKDFPWRSVPVTTLEEIRTRGKLDDE